MLRPCPVFRGGRKSTSEPSSPTRRLARDLVGSSVFVIAGGPSLKGFRVRGPARPRAHDRRQAISLSVPWAETGVTYRPGVASLSSRSRRAVCEQRRSHDRGRPRQGRPDRACHLSAADLDCGIQPRPLVRRHGENSGFAAVAIALKRGARRIALLGFDLNGPGHHHAEYVWASRFGPAASALDPEFRDARDRGPGRGRGHRELQPEVSDPGVPVRDLARGVRMIRVFVGCAANGEDAEVAPSSSGRSASPRPSPSRSCG